MTVPYGENQYIYGIHDPGGEHLLMDGTTAKGWVLVTEAIGADPDDTTGQPDLYKRLADQGLGVIVRLNHAYGPDGTIPLESKYPDFARRAANFVQASPGAHIWIIGNEMNLSREQPRKQDSDEPEVITPRRYAECYKLVRQVIKLLPGHEDDQVVVGPIGPWSADTKYKIDPQGQYPANFTGDWVIYLRDILLAIGPDACDAIAIHAYSHGYAPDLVYSDAKMGPPFKNRYLHFYTYKDQMEAIPKNMRHLPVYLTETNGDVNPDHSTWPNLNTGWVKNVYKEIDDWNKAGNQQIRCVLLYRWPRYDDWYLEGKDQVHQDLREAMAENYTWDPAAQSTRPDPPKKPAEPEIPPAKPNIIAALLLTIFWLMIQLGFNGLINRADLGGIEQFGLRLFQIVAGFVTLLPIVVYYAVDLRIGHISHPVIRRQVSIPVSPQNIVKLYGQRLLVMGGLAFIFFVLLGIYLILRQNSAAVLALLFMISLAIPTIPAVIIASQFFKGQFDTRLPNMRGIQLAGQNLDGLKDLKGLDLSNANLEAAQLQNASLDQTVLQRANLRGAKLAGATLIEANLQGADLRQAELVDDFYANLGAPIVAATLIRANLRAASLEQALLRYVDFSQAHLDGANLTETDLEHADFSQTQLNNAVFFKADAYNTNLTGARMIQANLRESAFKNSRMQLVDLQEADMRDINLEDTDLSDANLQKADLTRASLSSTNLQRANLERANLQQANVLHANLNEANLKRANLEQITGRVDLRDADLTGATLEGADIPDAELDRSKLHGVNLSNANLAGAMLTGAKLQKVDLTYANLTGADLSGATLTDIDLKGANLLDTKIDLDSLPEKWRLVWKLANGVPIRNLVKHNLAYMHLSGAVLEEANLTNSNFSYANLNKANLAKASMIGVEMWDIDLEGANLLKANLTGSVLRDGKLDEANLQQATLRDADLRYVEANGANFYRANLKRASLEWGQLKGADFRQANLAEANLYGANLQGTTLEEANLSRANLEGTDLTQANLSGANLSNASSYYGNTRLFGANLTGANLTGADLRGAILDDANLTGAIYSSLTRWPDDFSTSNLSSAILQDANDTAVHLFHEAENDKSRLQQWLRLRHQAPAWSDEPLDLGQGTLDNLDLTGSDLQRINVAGLNLKGLTLVDVNLSGANLNGAFLHRVSLERANLRGANLSGAVLDYTNLSGAILAEADLTGAIYSSVTRWPDDFDPEAHGAIYAALSHIPNRDYFSIY